MLLSHSSSLLYHVDPIKPSLTKSCTKTKVKISTHHPKTNGFSMKNNDEKYLFKSCCSHPPASELATTATVDLDDVDAAGIGILEFFEGKNIFITGATGLLGKVLVEKLLRSTSVGKVYLLIKAKDKEAAFDRLKHEIINSELFTCLKKKYGTSYDSFVREKLIPIFGDISKPNLGMDYESIDAIRKDVHIIIHSAACTSFNERYDLLVDANVIAPQRVMRFAKTCNKLQLFTHISTAYVNEGLKEGVILEKPLIMGELIGRNGEQLDVADELSLLLASSSSSAHNDHDGANFFRKLGRQRAEVFGLNPTYRLSKAMGEMSLNEIKGNVPLLIIRPSTVESCYHEPLPGWIQGIRMLDPVINSYGKGQLPVYFGNPQVPLDLIPVDMVVNTTIAAIAKHGNSVGQQINIVYHTTSGFKNPVTFSDIFEYVYEYFKAAPLIESANITKVKFYDDFEEFSKCLKEEIFQNCGVAANGRLSDEERKMIRRCNARAGYAQQLCKIYEFASFFKARFDTSNTQKLIEEMSMEEQRNFKVDTRNVDWKNYFLKIHLPGLKKYVLNQ